MIITIAVIGRKQEHLTKPRLMMIFERIFLCGHVCVAFTKRALEVDKTLETKEIIYLFGRIDCLGKI